MLQKILIVFHTVKYLRFTQVYHQLWYRLKSKLNIVDKGSISYENVLKINFAGGIYNNESYLKKNTFKFINIEQDLESIDWNYSRNGKLWTYNLNYFDFINQNNVDVETSLRLLQDFTDNYDTIKDGKEPYPTSLRIINIIKFVLINKIDKKFINDLIAKDAFRLTKNLEYHLLANHLLENAFALFFAGKYLQNKKLLARGEKLLKEQLEEQILDDGAHFELSPMYHQLMLYRVLDSIQLCDKNEEMYSLLLQKARIMCGWLKQMTYKNGDIPLFNDSAFNINPTTKELLRYTKQLGIESKSKTLSQSGYRKIVKGNYEIIVDTGKIGPDYQPGHAHSDTFNFVLYKDGKPFIVDTGTSTYNPTKRRKVERSTSSHNTVQIGIYEQVEVWSSFRVARRSVPNVFIDTEDKIEAELNYATTKAVHKRSFNFKEDKIVIVDSVEAKQLCNAFIHFHPDVDVKVDDDIIKTNMGNIEVKGLKKIKVEKYNYAPQFNVLKPSTKVEIIFFKQITTEITVL